MGKVNVLVTIYSMSTYTYSRLFCAYCVFFHMDKYIDTVFWLGNGVQYSTSENTSIKYFS